MPQRMAQSNYPISPPSSQLRAFASSEFLIYGSRPFTPRRAAEGRLAAINAPTYRDVRREAARNHEQRSAAVGRASAEASHELAAMHGSLAAAVNALRIEEKLVKERGHANQYANYLVSMRLMNENADD